MKSALLLIDIQHDLMPGGPVQVPDADQVLPRVAELVKMHDLVVATRDYHPEWHTVFASTYGKPHYSEMVTRDGRRKVLQPDHCVQNSWGSYLAMPIEVMSRVEEVYLRGDHIDVDGYSAFREADLKTSTGLAEDMRERDVGHLVICGLALEDTVLHSALDGLAEGFRITVDLTACRGRDARMVNEAIERMRGAGVVLQGDQA